MSEDERIAEIMNRVQAMLGEHCNGFVLIAEFECEDGDTVTPQTWGGGFNRAFGLACRAYLRMKNKSTRSDTDLDEDDDDGDEWKAKV